MSKSVAPPEDIGPIAGWDDGPVDDACRNEVATFARWIRYLKYPNQHGGYRRYVCRGAVPDGCGYDCGYVFNSPEKLPLEELASILHPRVKDGDPSTGWVTSRAWDLQSVIHEFDDLPALFHAVHTFCGMRWRDSGSHDQGSMEATFDHLTDGQLCNAEARRGGDRSGSELYKRDQSYEDFRDALMKMTGIMPDDPRYQPILSYRQTLLRDAERSENQIFQIADALGRYRGAFLGARGKIVRRMNLMTEWFAEFAFPKNYGTWAPPNEFLLSTVIGAVFTVAGIGFGPLGGIAYGIITNAIAGLIVGEITEDQSGNSPVPADVRPPPFSQETSAFVDLLNWFMDEMNQIGDDAFDTLAPSGGGSLIHITRGKLQKVNDEIAALPLEQPPK